MKSLILLWTTILEDFEDRCCTSAARDVKTLTSRVEHEGLSFLTITLPDYGKDFEKSLDRRKVDHDLFSGFHFSGGLPQFLGGFLDLVFDRKSGRLLDSPSIDAIHAIRQLTLMFGKLRIECSDERTAKAFRSYIECEKEVRLAETTWDSASKEAFSRIAAKLWYTPLSQVNDLVSHYGIVPKHGPGSTADKLLGNQKLVQDSWTSRLERVFPSSDFLIPNYRYHRQLDRVELLEPGAEVPVRVVSVPKTLKSPRIIALEPTCMQYAQQGIMEQLYEKIEADDIASLFVGFSDQEPNRRLACLGSRSGNLATLDLKEASDRVSNQHVRLLLAPFPDLFEAVDACRSRKADVPGHGVIRLAKFASMGSALSFPFEAMVFTTVVFMGIEKALNRRLSAKDIKSLVGEVRVYGDDIIVPVRFVHHVVRELETFGFQVNSGKSFWTGEFRESCGKEYYAGEDVSIIRMRSFLPTRRDSAQEVVSTVSLRNQAYQSGLWKLTRHLDEILERVLRHFPIVEPTSAVIGRHSFLGYVSEKNDVNLHRPLVRGYVEYSRSPKDPLDDYGALLKFFLKRGQEPFADRDHLERYGRPEAVGIKLRWATPY